MSESRLVALARQAQNLQPERRANTLSELRGRWSDYVNPYQTPPQQLSDLANPLRWPAMAVEGIQTAVETVPRMLQPGYDYSDTRQAAEDAFNVAGVVGAGSLLGTAAKPSNAVGAFGGGRMAKAASKNNLREMSFDELMGEVNQAKEPLFVRWSAGPEYDLIPGASSKDYQTGQAHIGLSALEISPQDYLENVYRLARDYSYLRGESYPNNRPHIYRGKVVGTDSDGAPSITPSEYVGTLDNYSINLIDDETVAKRLSLENAVRQGEFALKKYEKEGKAPFAATYTPENVESWRQQLQELGGPVQWTRRDKDEMF